jgi:anti-sigma28 factor (negative regulator of flagellin synthesis)
MGQQATWGSRQLHGRTLVTMASRHTDPADDESADDDPKPPTEGIYDDNALRAEIDRLIDNEPDDRPSDESERRARVEALRAKIQGGSYMSDAMLGEIVDKLLRKWKL